MCEVVSLGASTHLPLHSQLRPHHGMWVLGDTGGELVDRKDGTSCSTQ